jgi:hypothetical protein
MSTTTRKKPIDLSKCKVGQRVKLRSGEIAIFQGQSGGTTYPFLYEDNTGDSVGEVRTATQYGCYSLSEPNHKLDIVALLPLLKKAGKPGKKKADNYILDNLRRLIADFEASRDVFTKEINRLKGLLKP